MAKQTNQPSGGGQTDTSKITVESLDAILDFPSAVETGKAAPTGGNFFGGKANKDLSFLDNNNPNPDHEEEEEEEEEETPEEKAARLEAERLAEEEEEEEEEEEDPDPAAQAKKKKTPEEIQAALDKMNGGGGDDDDDPDPALAGKVNKGGMITVLKKMIQSKKITPFVDKEGKEEDLSKYTMDDIQELLEANFSQQKESLEAEIPANFIKNQPEEVQIALKYVADGGNDLKGLFRALSHVEEVRELDPEDESDQEKIALNYLTATGFTPEDAQEEVDGWKDRKELKAKALKFKPKLDLMTKDVVARKMHDQDQARKKQQDQIKNYTDNVFKVIQGGEIGGVKLDRKKQEDLYAGLVQPTYKSQITGKATNQLGHLLEKFQWIEPNHGLIAEALWLLSDPDGYRAKIGERGKKKASEDTFRKLKQEERTKTGSASAQETDDDAGRKTSKGLNRPARNFFGK